MKNKKGFTLVELLAVIAILAILMLLVTPSVLKMLNQGKKNTFVTQVQSVWKAAETKYINDAISTANPGPYYFVGSKIANSNDTTKAIDFSDTKLVVSDNNTLAYYVTFKRNDGTIDKIIVTDGTYYYVSDTNATIDITAKDVKEVEDGQSFTCDEATETCTYNLASE